MKKKLKLYLLINTIIKKVKEEDEAFDSTLCLDDKEQFFANIESWKLTFENDYLIEHPYLLREPIRHKTIYKFSIKPFSNCYHTNILILVSKK